MTYTDKDIPISCSECENWIEEGIRPMMIHILQTHPEYEPGVVYVFASDWMQDAYEQHDEWEYNHLSPSQKRAYRATQNGR